MKQQAEKFLRSVEYDESCGMVKVPVLSRGYHTKLQTGYVHPVRDSVEYALGLLDCGIEQERAKNIFRRIAALQDKNPESETYGLWAYFYEEPLSEMSPPDYNWADFIGKILLMAAMDYSADWGEDFREEIRETILAACACAVKRNAGLHYTNIAVMECLLTMGAGEYYGCEKYLEYGREKLERVYWFIQNNGSVSEYNSPVYTLVALEDLHYIKRYVKNSSAQRLAGALSEICWQCVGRHFHSGTQQWGGPQARNYDDFLTRQQRSMLHLAVGIPLNGYPEQFYLSLRAQPECPESLKPLFFETRNIFQRERTSKGFCYPCFSNSRIASWQMTEHYTLGSFQHEEMWDQLRGLLGYFGTAENPYCLRLRTLHDGFDFSSGELHAAQKNGKILGVVNFANDRGDTHICLDNLKDCQTVAEDLRIRFQICGRIQDLDISRNEREIRVDYKELKLRFCYSAAEFDGNPLRIELTENADALCFDLVLYQGEKQTILFDEERGKAAVFLLEMDEITEKLPEVEHRGKKVLTSFEEMSVLTRRTSGPFPMMNLEDEIRIDGRDIEEICGF